MRKKLLSLFRYAAGVSFPFVAMAAGHRPHHPATLPSAPDQATDMAALLAQSDPAPHGTSLSDLVLAMFANTDWTVRAIYLFAGMIVGGLIGAFFSHRMRRFRRLLALAVLALALITCVLVNDPLAFGVGSAGAGFAAFWLLRIIPSTEGFEAIFGNARPAARSEIAMAGHMLAFDAASNSYNGKPGIPLGTLVEQSL